MKLKKDKIYQHHHFGAVKFDCEVNNQYGRKMCCFRLVDTGTPIFISKGVVELTVKEIK